MGHLILERRGTSGRHGHEIKMDQGLYFSSFSFFLRIKRIRTL